MKIINSEISLDPRRKWEIDKTIYLKLINNLKIYQFEKFSKIFDFLELNCFHSLIIYFWTWIRVIDDSTRRRLADLGLSALI